MKQFILTMSLSLIALFGFAQTNDFVFFTDNSDKFTLYLNNVKQNTTAANNVKAENISGKSVPVKIVFERSGVPTLNKTLSINSDNKEIKIQLIKGREDVYSFKTISSTPRDSDKSSNDGNSVTKDNGSTETKDHGHGNNGYGNNNHNNNNNHGNNHGNNNHGNNHNGYGNNGYGNNGYGNYGYPNGGYPNVGYPGGQYGPSDNIYCHVPMNDNDFKSLRSMVKSKSFDSSRLTIAKQACMSNCLRAEQVAGLCNVFSYESTKLEFAKFAYDYCFDRRNYYKVGYSFSYSSSVDDLNNYIFNHPINNQTQQGYYPPMPGIQSDNANCHFFMTNEDFADLQRMINRTAYSNTKMTLAKQACTNNCMSAEQIREICRMFTFDSDRLTFAKYAYDFCYDRRNYFKVNDVFSFSSSINELNRYINGRY